MQELLRKHNPIWFGKPLVTGIERTCLRQIISYIPVPHIVAISGARRSGKSYLLKQLTMHLLHTKIPAENILSLNFEDPYFINHGTVDVLDALLSEYRILQNPSGKTYLFLDEIQNIPGWYRWLRDIYDRDSNVKIFITGSNSELLSVDLASHLTGRVLSFENFPFSFYEFLKSISSFQLPTALQYDTLYSSNSLLQHHLENIFKAGLFPEVVKYQNEELLEEILRQYFQQVVFKDIVPKFSIRNSKTIEQLAYYCSTSFASRFSYNKLAAVVNSNENTVKEYLSYLEKAYLFFVIERFSYSLQKKTRYAKKIYISDEGLRNATAGSFSPDIGRHAENLVFLHLRRKTKQITFWQNDGNSSEIDFIVHEKDNYLLCNVSYTNDISEREYKGFSIFIHSNNLENYRCIVVSKNIYKSFEYSGVTIEIVPLWLFLLNTEEFLPGNNCLL